MDHSKVTKSKEEVHRLDLGATGGLKVQAWHRWILGTQHLTEDLGLWRKGNPGALLVGLQTGAASMENSTNFLRKLKNGTVF